MFVLCIFDGAEGQRIVPVYPLRNFLQEFGLSPAKPADSSDEPGTLFDRHAVLQNDDILRPADGHGFCQYLWRVFICPVKFPHPAQIPGGEAGGIRVHTAQIFSGGDSRAFFRPGADELTNLIVQLHLRKFRRNQSIQHREHGAVVYRFSDIHELLLSGAERLFSLSINVDSSMTPQTRSTELPVFWKICSAMVFIAGHEYRLLKAMLN